MEKRMEEKNDKYHKLRTIAEGKLDWQKINCIPDEEFRKAVEELNIHQIELELQNQELRETQHRLESIKDAYQDLYDFAPIGYCTLDEKGTLLQLNLTLGKQLGKTRKQLKNTLLYDYMTDKSKDDFFLHLRTLFHENNTNEHITHLQFIDDSGQEHIYQIKSIFQQDGKTLRTALTDVTNKMNLEEQLKETLRATTDGIWTWDFSTNTLFFSDRWYQMLGYQPQEFEATYENWLNLIHPDDKEHAVTVAENFLKHKPDNYENSFRLHTKQGNYRWIQAKAKVVERDENGEAIRMIGHHEDITARRNAEEKLKKAHDELKKLNNNLENKVKERTKRIKQLLQQKDEFINQLGHDLKNPLGPLTHLLPLIEEHIEEPRYKEMMHIAIRNTEYIRQLVIKTIQLAQLKSPNTELKYEHYNLHDEITEIIETSKLMFKENQITVQNNLPNDLTVHLDRLRIHEVFNNLLNNAVKYTTGKPGSITIDSTSNKDTVTISITDTGMGMTSEQLEQVFNEFYKADSSRHDFDSSGLGMSICKRIIEMHHGKIWAESKGLGKGSTIFFTLPTSA